MRLSCKFDEFVNWLRSKPAEHVVGYAGHAEACPLAKWYESQLTFVRIGKYLSSYGVQHIHSGYVGRLPEWAAQFVESVDTIYREQPVTAAQCLDLLERLHNGERLQRQFLPYVSITAGA